jgi:hypothetical protein
MQAQFSQMRPVAISPSVAPRMPLYPPGAPGIGQQFMYGQGPPAMMPPQVNIIMFSFDIHLLFCFDFVIFDLVIFMQCCEQFCVIF